MRRGRRLRRRLRACTAELARIIHGDLDRPVPTCPGWTFRSWPPTSAAATGGRPRSWRPAGPRPCDARGSGRQAAGGPGAARLLADRGRGPGDRGRCGRGGDLVWTMTDSGRRASGRAAGPTRPPCTADAQLAAGATPTSTPAWPRRRRRMPPPLADAAAGPARELRGDGQSLHLHATDPGLAAPASGRSPEPVRITVQHGHGKADVAVRGPAADLLLILTRRLPPSAPGVEILGQQPRPTHWLQHTPF